MDFVQDTNNLYGMIMKITTPYLSKELHARPARAQLRLPDEVLRLAVVLGDDSSKYRSQVK